MAPPLRIGLTGGVAAGKSEALSAFGRLGVATISTDEVVHEMLASDEVRDRLVARWGEGVAPEGRVDRARVGEIVFDDSGELAWLESQLHPLVGERITAWLTDLPVDTEVAVVEVPLLFETGMEPLFDATVAVVAAEEVRGERAAARGHVLVEGRDARQLTQEEKADRADHVVLNDGTLELLEERLGDLVEELQSDRADGERDR